MRRGQSPYALRLQQHLTFVQTSSASKIINKNNNINNDPSWTCSVRSQLCHKREAGVQNHRLWRGEDHGDTWRGRGVRGAVGGLCRNAPMALGGCSREPLCPAAGARVPADSGAERPPFPPPGNASGEREGERQGPGKRERGARAVSAAAPLSGRCRFLRETCACGFCLFEKSRGCTALLSPPAPPFVTCFLLLASWSRGGVHGIFCRV